MRVQLLYGEVTSPYGPLILRIRMLTLQADQFSKRASHLFTRSIPAICVHASKCSNPVIEHCLSTFNMPRYAPPLEASLYDNECRDHGAYSFPFLLLINPMSMH